MDDATWLERVRALIPDIRERARQAEGLRRLPDETMKELQEAQVLRALQPRRFGGLELDPQSFSRPRRGGIPARARTRSPGSPRTSPTRSRAR